MRQCLLFLPPPLTPHSLLLTTMNLCNFDTLSSPIVFCIFHDSLYSQCVSLCIFYIAPNSMYVVVWMHFVLRILAYV